MLSGLDTRIRRSVTRLFGTCQVSLVVAVIVVQGTSLQRPTDFQLVMAGSGIGEKCCGQVSRCTRRCETMFPSETTRNSIADHHEPRTGSHPLARLANSYRLDNLVELGNGPIREFVVQDFTLVGGSANIMKVVDVRNAHSPTIVASLDLGGEIVGMEWVGTKLYAVTNRGGLRIVNMEDVSHPAIIGQLDADAPFPGEGFGEDIVIHDGLAYFLQNGPVLQILDVSSSKQIRVLGKLSLDESLGTIRDIAYANSTVYVISANFVIVVDVSNRQVPRLANAIAATDLRVWSGMAINGTVAYVGAATAGLVVLDISNPLEPHELATIPSKNNRPFCQPTLAGSVLLVPAGENGIQIFDVSDSLSPVLIGGTDTDANAISVVVDASRVYLLEQDVGISVYEIIGPGSIKLISTIDLFAPMIDVHLQENILYVLSPIGHLRAWDISDPLQPRDLSDLAFSRKGVGSMEWTAGGLVVHGASGTLFVIDVSVPSDLRLAAELRLPESPIYSLSTWGNKAYAITNRGLVVVNIDGNRSEVVGRFALADDFGLTESTGTLLYVAGSKSLLVLDVTNPGAIQELAELNFQHGKDAKVMEVTEDNLIVGGRTGLVFVDISKPQFPRLRLEVFNTSLVSALTVKGDLLFVADNYFAKQEISIWDMSLPNQPTVVGRRELSYMRGAATLEYFIMGVSAGSDLLATAVGRCVVMWRLSNTEPTESPTPTVSPSVTVARTPVASATPISTPPLDELTVYIPNVVRGR